jgi:hypothetical protein
MTDVEHCLCCLWRLPVVVQEPNVAPLHTSSPATAAHEQGWDLNSTLHFEWPSSSDVSSSVVPHRYPALSDDEDDEYDPNVEE